MNDFKVGQFYRDTVNGDLLKLLGFSDEVIDTRGPAPFLDPEFEETVQYVRCQVITRDGVYFGIQEMKSAHLNRDRFSKVAGARGLWLKWKHRKIRLAK